MVLPFDNYNANDDYDYDSNENQTQLQNDCEGNSYHTIDVPLRRHKMHQNEGFDRSPPRSRPLSTYSDSMAVPRIVITPTPEDNENRRASWAFPEDSNKKTSKPFETFELLSSKLSQLYANSTNLNSIYDESNENSTSNHCQTPTMNDDDKILANSQELENSGSENDSDNESETASESEESNSGSGKQKFELTERTRNDSMYEIEDIHDTEIRSSNMYGMEMHHDSDDESADIIEFIIDNGGCDQMSNCDTVEFNDHLSVIFEEDERSKMMSMCSSNSSSITLANDDSNSKHIESDEEECESSKTYSDNDNNSVEESDESDDEDDQSTSVTVRLPLRLSFSRSSNDEEITTVMVGKSEIKVDEINEKSCKTPIINQDSSPDVSVSICLRPKNPPVSTQTSTETSSNNKSFDCDEEDSEAEVSFSISLPLRHRAVSPPPTPLFVRPTFTRQHTLSPVPRSRDEFEYKVWNRGFSIERDTSIAKSIKPNKQHSSNNNDDNMDDESNEVKSMRDRIAAFEAFLPIKNKEELQRQNACGTSFDESNEEKQEYYHQQHQEHENEYINENVDQPIYVNRLPQTTEYRDYCDKNDKLNMESTSYESFVTSQCNRYDLQPEPAPEYLDTTIQHFKQESVEQKIANEELDDDDDDDSDEEDEEEEDFKANLSVQQKIAAFEQPAANQVPKIDARQEICMAREMNSNQESAGNRFLSKVTNKHLPSYENSDVTHLSINTIQSNDSSKPSNKKVIGMHLSPFEESELEETDSGVDIHRRVSEDVDTESECYSELRKLTRYERAATHSRLFRILQEYEKEMGDAEKAKAEEEIIMPLNRPKKIVHNVSITRRQNPELAKQAETMSERRERLQLGYNSSSIDNDNASSSASPSCASPISTVSVNEKLIDELVHSVLQQTKRRNLQSIPLEKIQAAARRALIQQNEENDSCDTYSSFDSTPALTPHEFNDDCYDSDSDRHTSDILPSKAFKHLQEQSTTGRRYKSWAARCPRVLSSKTVNRDLSRVTETRESQTPEREREHQYVYPF